MEGTGDGPNNENVDLIASLDENASPEDDNVGSNETNDDQEETYRTDEEIAISEISNSEMDGRS